MVCPSRIKNLFAVRKPISLSANGKIAKDITKIFIYTFSSLPSYISIPKIATDLLFSQIHLSQGWGEVVVPRISKNISGIVTNMWLAVSVCMYC